MAFQLFVLLFSVITFSVTNADEFKPNCRFEDNGQNFSMILYDHGGTQVVPVTDIHQAVQYLNSGQCRLPTVYPHKTSCEISFRGGQTVVTQSDSYTADHHEFFRLTSGDQIASLFTMSFFSLLRSRTCKDIEVPSCDHLNSDNWKFITNAAKLGFCQPKASECRVKSINRPNIDFWDLMFLDLNMQATGDYKIKTEVGNFKIPGEMLQDVRNEFAVAGFCNVEKTIDGACQKIKDPRYWNSCKETASSEGLTPTQVSMCVSANPDVRYVASCLRTTNRW